MEKTRAPANVLGLHAFVIRDGCKRKAQERIARVRLSSGALFSDLDWVGEKDRLARGTACARTQGTASGPHRARAPTGPRLC